MAMRAVVCVWLLAGLTMGCSPIGLAIGSGAVVARSVVQERSTKDALDDTAMEVDLRARLLGTSASLFADVSVDVVEGRIVLTGSVPEPIDKVTATELAWETMGVRSVADELTVALDAGAIAYAEDAVISNTLRLTLLGDAEVASVNYNVTTVSKVVHVTGLARSPAELSRVLAHAAGVDGVERVVSHVLTIDDPRRNTASAGSS